MPLVIQRVLYHWLYRRLYATGDTEGCIPLVVQRALDHWWYKRFYATGDTEGFMPLVIQRVLMQLAIQRVLYHW